ncbi:major capsid protein [Capybara microvirus Cap3_SP_581]|nr:major capsid protein [Capybara microvirus Cap3_SP_581]
MSSPLFGKVAGARPKHTTFDLSYEKIMNIYGGKLNIVMCDEVVPGDVIKLGCDAVLRANPMNAPVYSSINGYVQYFFWPYRFWPEWETFITRGVSGNEEISLPTYEDSWTGTNHGRKKHTIWDQLGFPISQGEDKLNGFALPLAFPWYAYNDIYNEFFRDENLQEEVSLTNVDLLNVNYSKDYFTSALTSQQRGTAPALPLVGTAKALFDTPDNFNSDFLNNTSVYGAVKLSNTLNPRFAKVGVRGAEVEKRYTNCSNIGQNDNYNYAFDREDELSGSTLGSSLGLSANFMDYLNRHNVVDVSQLITADVSDLRFMFQVQKWRERSMRGGVRYTEFLQSMYATCPRDDRLQRPEYIGGCKIPILNTEVIQTSSTDSTSPQGHLAGKGIGLGNSRIGNYKVKEFGLIMGLFYVRPKPMYNQGINRQWLRKDTFDFFNPLFVGLSEQGIYNAEIYAQTDQSGLPNPENEQVFGFQGMYDEMRHKMNMAVGDMRDTYDYWHTARKFNALPHLNSNFIQCKHSDFSRIFAVPSAEGWIVNFHNQIKAIRPLPLIGEPGLIDHF